MIGQSQSIHCSFGGPTPATSVMLLFNNEVLKGVNGSVINYEIETVTDLTHNQQYSCVGTALGSDTRYLNFSVIALSKQNINYYCTLVF